MSENVPAVDLGRQIRMCVERTAELILDTSELCLLAHQRHREEDLRVLLRAAKIPASTFRKYLGIAHAAGALSHHITQVGDGMIEAAVKENVLHHRNAIRKAALKAARTTE